MTPQEVEVFLLESFEANYQRLALETGAAVTPDVKAAALEQVVWYYRKMREVAESVTETEVRLTLPECHTPKGRRFTLSGVVDIVREGDKTVMYDVKTHFDADAALGQLDKYTRQLNVYAYIWEKLRGNALDATALIATKPTREMRSALRSGDPTRLSGAVSRWEPCITVPLNEVTVSEVIHDFGEVVDRIEAREFSAPPVLKLEAPVQPGGTEQFATAVCGNCDVRFSCNSFRQHEVRKQGGTALEAVMQGFLTDYGPDYERGAGSSPI